jgi:hypothetical protein
MDSRFVAGQEIGPRTPNLNRITLSEVRSRTLTPLEVIKVE